MHLKHGEFPFGLYPGLTYFQLSNRLLGRFTNQVPVNTIVVDEASQIEIGLCYICCFIV
jgi:hypothetical protein